MKIGFFADSYFPRKDGQVYTVKTWKQKLEQRGHEVYVFYPESEYDHEDNEIPLRSVKNPWYQHYIGVPTGTGEIPELDIVHCHSPGPVGLLGKYYARKKGLPDLYTFHTPLEEYIPQVLKLKTLTKAVRSVYSYLDTKFLRSFDKVTSNTNEMPRGVDFIKLPVGIDMEFFRPTRDSFLEEENLERPVAGYSGRLSEEKNIDLLIEYFEEVDGTLIIAGEGRDEKRLKSMASENVVFKDFIDREKLPEYYSYLDVFVTASDSDTLSLTTLEASSCGTPVLAPDLHPFDKTITGNGELYRAEDAEAFRSKLQKISRSEYNTRDAVKSYSIEHSIDELLEIYGGLIEDGN